MYWVGDVRELIFQNVQTIKRKIKEEINQMRYDKIEALYERHDSR